MNKSRIEKLIAQYKERNMTIISSLNEENRY